MDKKLTETQELFLDLLYADGVPKKLIERAKDVKERAGYNASTRVIQILRALKEEIAARNQEFIIFDSGESIAALQEIVRTPTLPGADNAIKASNSLLDRAGIGKNDKQEIEIKGSQGIVILPAKKHPIEN